MARSSDRIADFRDAFHIIALKKGFNKVKISKVKNP